MMPTSRPEPVAGHDQAGGAPLNAKPVRQTIVEMAGGYLTDHPGRRPAAPGPDRARP
jgi:hypothetical protein